MTTSGDLLKLLSGLPLGRGQGMTNLAYHIPAGHSVTYWSEPADLRRKVLNYATTGNKYFGGDALTAVLNKFDITRGGHDEFYEATMGNFLTPEEVYTRAVGYTVNCNNPLERIARDDVAAHAAFMTVYYKHRYTSMMSFTAYYTLYAVGQDTAAVCFGYI